MVKRGAGTRVGGKGPCPLAALGAQQHALGIYIADLECDDFQDAQSGAAPMANAAMYFGADAACSSSLTSSTLNTPPWVRHNSERATRQIRPVKRYREAEAQRRDRAI